MAGGFEVEYEELTAAATKFTQARADLGSPDVRTAPGGFDVYGFPVLTGAAWGFVDLLARRMELLGHDAGSAAAQLGACVREYRDGDRRVADTFTSLEDAAFGGVGE